MCNFKEFVTLYLSNKAIFRWKRKFSKIRVKIEQNMGDNPTSLKITWLYVKVPNDMGSYCICHYIIFPNPTMSIQIQI